MKSRNPQLSNLNLNLTAMLDVVFNLVFFFIAISNMAGNELPRLDVPRPEHSRAETILERRKVTVNVIPEVDGSGRARLYQVGLDKVATGDEKQLTELLRQEVKIDPKIEIDLRVDRSVHYDAVQPVMHAITRAGVGRINLVAHIEP